LCQTSAAGRPKTGRSMKATGVRSLDTASTPHAGHPGRVSGVSM
jgi:hypothetical protein